MEADVVIIGMGIAGACAALSARAAGASVLVIERSSGGGGTSAMSSGIFYMGGGTALQRDLGVEDDPDEMYRYMLASCGVTEPAILQRFCEGCPEHFDWLEAQGIRFARSLFADKHMCPPTSEGLLSTGNE
jgi:succinate dehydrogenase/fumarate reductase flavoprotein subunit